MNDLPNGFKLADLIVRRLEGKLNEEEKQFLEEWKYAKEENLVLFHKLSQNIEKRYFQRQTELEKANKDKIWLNIDAQLKQKRTMRLKQQLMKVAAVLVIAIAISFLLVHVSKNAVYTSTAIIPPGQKEALLVLNDGQKYQLSKVVEVKKGNIQISNSTDGLIYQKTSENNTRQLAYNTIIVPKGGEYKLTLMDGTKVWLNSNSKLKYPVHFGNGIRTVELEGEAFFKVAKDSLHPFIVDVNKTQVKVLGTSFNVNAYSQDDEITTTLVEGKVEINDDFWEKREILTPNDQFSINKRNGIHSKQKVNTRVFTAWKDGRFVFEDESLEKIMTRLSRWYDVEVFFLNNSTKNLRFTGDLARYENINEILEMIEVTQKVKFSIKDRSLIIEKYK